MKEDIPSISHCGMLASGDLIVAGGGQFEITNQRFQFRLQFLIISIVIGTYKVD